MLTPTPPKYQKRRRIKPKRTGPTTPPLLLVSAEYVPNDAQITLTFNRAIDVSGMDLNAVIVKDGVAAYSILQGVTLSMYGSNAVIVYMDQIDSYSGSNATLDAPEDVGIVAMNDGVHWAGVMDYVLIP